MNQNELARVLLSINAVRLNPVTPFQFSSGLLSPIYCDNRLIISHPKERQQITQAFLEVIHRLSLDIDVVAGTATAGIPHAAWLAAALNKPMIYIRSKPKTHGTGSQIEGQLTAGQRVLLIEDLISTGGSVINAVEAIRKAKAIVTDALCIFTYGLEVAQQNLANASLRYHALTDFHALCTVAVEQQLIKKENLPSLTQWQSNPKSWQPL